MHTVKEQVDTSEVFGSSLKTVLENDKGLRWRGRRILAILNKPVDDPHRQRIVKVMERHAIAHLDYTLPVNWSTVDWPTIIQDLLKIFLALLPLLLSL